MKRREPPACRRLREARKGTVVLTLGEYLEVDDVVDIRRALARAFPGRRAVVIQGDCQLVLS